MSSSTLSTLRKSASAPSLLKPSSVLRHIKSVGSLVATPFRLLSEATLNAHNAWEERQNRFCARWLSNQQTINGQAVSAIWVIDGHVNTFVEPGVQLTKFVNDKLCIFGKVGELLGYDMEHFVFAVNVEVYVTPTISKPLDNIVHLALVPFSIAGCHSPSNLHVHSVVASLQYVLYDKKITDGPDYNRIIEMCTKLRDDRKIGWAFEDDGAGVEVTPAGTHHISCCFDSSMT